MSSPSFDSAPASPAAPSASRSNKALWATVGALGVAVVALGGVLLSQQGRNGAAAPAAAVTAPAIVAAAPPVRAPDDFRSDAAPAVAPPAPPAPPAPAVRAPEVLPPPTVAQNGAAPAAGTAPAPAPARICSTCGHVETVRSLQRQKPSTSGVGAVAGGVLGGVLGNQIGHGGGRTAATVIGAVGGGFAGNEVEKRTQTVTVYEVGVRMQDGSLRHVETATAPPIGKPVTLNGGVLKPADGRK